MVIDADENKDEDRTPGAFIMHRKFVFYQGDQSEHRSGPPAHDSLYQGMGIVNFQPNARPQHVF